MLFPNTGAPVSDFTDREICENEAHTWTSSDPSSNGQACEIRVSLSQCCLVGTGGVRRCELKQIIKVTPLGQTDTQGLVFFSAGCAAGAELQSEIDLFFPDKV
jgi:hypothetical protein